MFEELFYRYNPWWESDFQLEKIIERVRIMSLLEKSLKDRNIIMLTGLRRVGKTTSLKLLIKKLIDKEKIDPKRIFYISLDDYLIKDKNISEIVDEFRLIHKISFKEKIYLFFDEVAYKKDFAIQLKNLYDSQNVKIFASSSSASILKNQKSYLTGRNTIIEIMPLDFEEFLQFKNIRLSKSDEHLLIAYFEDYMKTGGIPEYVLNGDIGYLKELVDDILQKDIISFHGIKNTELLKDYFVLLMERSGKIISINKIANILDISPDTAKRYLAMFEDSYLIHTIQRYGKTNEKLLSPKKIYASDLGIRVLFTGFRDKGSLFENYVYLKIKNKNPYYLYKDGIEIDFFTENKTLIEVKYLNEMSTKQKKLFEETIAKEKILIKDIYDLDKIC